MKRILTLSFVIATTCVAFGQTQFELPGFETWENVAAPEEEPTEYSSLKTADALAGAAPQVLWRTSTAHSGSYACSLKVAPYNIFAGVSPNGIMTNGRVHASWVAADGYVFTDPANSEWNTPCNDRPDSLVGWIQYTPQSSDKGKVEVLLHDDTEEGRLPHTGVITHWVGKARYDITTSPSTWTRFSVPFEYYNDSVPDYILLVATAGDSLLSVDGSILLLDDIELIYNPLTVSIDPSGTQTVDVCNIGTTMTVTEGVNAGVINPVTREWKWSTTPGGPYNSFVVPETGTSYTPLFTTIDDFYVVCETNFGSQGIVTSNEVQITTTAGGNTVSISPVTSQNINENEDGTVLNTTECPATSVREWMWSTTSGSGYQSFSPTETNASYTPNFATSGTYYVICESDFSGDIKTSNEVMIVVDLEGTGIDEHGVKIDLFNSNNGLQLTYEGSQENANFEIYSINGAKVYETQISNGVSNHQLNAEGGIYVYRITSGNTIYTGKIKL